MSRGVLAREPEETSREFFPSSESSRRSSEWDSRAPSSASVAASNAKSRADDADRLERSSSSSPSSALGLCLCVLFLEPRREDARRWWVEWDLRAGSGASEEPAPATSSLHQSRSESTSSSSGDVEDDDFEDDDFEDDDFEDDDFEDFFDEVPDSDFFDESPGLGLLRRSPGLRLWLQAVEEIIRARARARS